MEEASCMSPITYRIAACFVLTLGLAALPCCGRSKPAVSVPARPTTHPHVLTGDRFDNAQPNSLEKVTLAYIYAGKEKAGWEFYDREYRLSDKAEMRKDINEVISRDPFFKI